MIEVLGGTISNPIKLKGVIACNFMLRGETPISYRLDNGVGSWRLECNESLLPMIQSLVGKAVIVHGRIVNSINQYNGVCWVNSIHPIMDAHGESHEFPD